MKLMPATPIILIGSAWDRGFQQSLRKPELKRELCLAVKERLDMMRNKLNDPHIKSFLNKQLNFTKKYSPESLDEIKGIAEGYGLLSDDLFTYLHLGVIDDYIGQEDGCSVFAFENTSSGPILTKNRDYQGAHKKLQQVFLSSDPDWGGRQCLFVGSLGSPGAFSSGMNSDGLAIADNRIGWSQPGIGWLRYFLMTKILTDSRTVEEALNLINSVELVGGGSIVMADKSGNLVSVELGHGRVYVDRGMGGFVSHTNHYQDPELAKYATHTQSDPLSASSLGRLDKINTDPKCHDNTVELRSVSDLLKSHETADRALCRHGIDGDSLTISSVIFCCKSQELYFCPSLPCENDWQVYTLNQKLV